MTSVVGARRAAARQLPTGATSDGKLRLQEHIHFAFCDSRTILLNEIEPRYFQLKGKAEAALRCVVDGIPIDDFAAKRLARLGLLAGNEERGHLPKPLDVDVPGRSVIECAERVGPSSVATLAMVALTCAKAGFRRRHTPFNKLLARLAQQQRNLPPSGHPDLTSVVEAAVSFHLARNLVPINRSCLPDSIALMDYLAAKGFRSHDLSPVWSRI